MPFVAVPGLKGKVYVAQKQGGEIKKHPCKDCYGCQLCSEGRCQVCLGQQNVTAGNHLGNKTPCRPAKSGTGYSSKGE